MNLVTPRDPRQRGPAARHRRVHPALRRPGRRSARADRSHAGRHADRRSATASRRCRTCAISASPGRSTVTGVSDTPSREGFSRAGRRRRPKKRRARRRFVQAARDAGVSASRRPSGDVEPLMKFYAQGRQGRRFRVRASAWRCRRSSRARTSCSASRRRPRADARRARRTASAISSSRRACRSSCGAAGPDAELLKAAEQRHAAARRRCSTKQVRRMLADPRAEALVDAVRGAVAAPAGRRQDACPTRCCSRTYDYTLAQAFKRETELFFDSIVREDRSVLDLLDGRLHVRQRAARAALRHSERHRRGVPARDARAELAYRRGLLGQGSMLMLTSVADRTSPVQRGKWIMEVLLGSPPPPPPPNVPALDDTKAVAAGRQAAVDARADGGAPEEPGVRVVPPRDRSARPRARELRRHRRVADQGQRRAGRRRRRAVRRHADRRPGGAARRRC